MSTARSVADEKNYYELLGVEREASKEEITRAYRNMAQIFHPDSKFFTDIIEDDADAKHISIFDRITKAYHTLLDEAKRAAYDKTLLNGTLKGWENQEVKPRTPKAVKKSSFGAVSNTGSMPEPLCSDEPGEQFVPVSEVIRRRRSTWHNLRKVFKLP